MEIILHRINTLNKLKKIPLKYGVEIDVRSNNSKLILNHEPFTEGELLDNYLEVYGHGTIIFNIKEAGIEEEVINLAKKFKLKSFFLLDVEMPYLYKAANNGQTNMAVRFSEYESIEIAKYFKKLVDWIWIDTVNILPIKSENLPTISCFKSCIVCPERWGRQKDILFYKKYRKNIAYNPDAVMTDINCVKYWENE